MEAFNSLSPPLCARFGGGGPKTTAENEQEVVEGRGGINWGCPSPKEEGEDAGCVLACERSRRRFCQPKPAAPQSSSSMATLHGRESSILDMYKAHQIRGERSSEASSSYSSCVA